MVNKILMIIIFLSFLSLSEFSFGAWTLQSGITCWRNITLNNQQATAVATGTPVILNFTLSPFSSCAKSDLSNYEIFNGFTGNIYFSSVEGNSLNFGSSTSLNSIPSGTNGNLIIVSVIDYQIPGTTTSTNGLTIGFKSFASSTLNNNDICESAQLTSTYGSKACDSNIWSYNQLFGGLSGNSLPTGWVANGVFSGNIINNPTNTVLIAPNRVYWGITNTLTSDSKGFSENTPGNVIYFLGMTPIAANAFYGTDYPFSLYTTNSIGPLLFVQGTAINFGSGCHTPNANLCVNVNSIASTSPVIATIPNIQPGPDFFGTSIISSSSFKFSLNFSKIISDTNTIGVGALNQVVLETSNTASANPETIYKIVSGINPPSGIYPQVSLGPLQKSVTLPTLTLSNTLIDQGQSILFTASTSGGIANYNYNYSIVNNNLVISTECAVFSSDTGCNANALVGNAAFANSVVFNQYDFGNFQVNVTAGVPSLTLNDQGFGTANSVVVAQMKGATANGIKTLIWVGGASGACPGTAYSLAWNTVLSHEATRSQFVGNVINTIIEYGANGIFFDPEECAAGDMTFANLSIFSSEMASNIMANVQIINPTINYGVINFEMQTAQGFVVANVINNANQISIINDPEKGPSLAFTTFAPNAPISKLLFGLVDVSIPSELTNVNGNVATAINTGMGLEVYNARFLEGNMIVANDIANALTNRYPNANGVIANMLFTGCTITTNTFFWTPPSALYTWNSMKAIVRVTDSVGDNSNSTYQTIGYNSATTLSILQVSNVLADKGQTELFTYKINGGTAPYTFNYVLQDSASAKTSNFIFGSCTITTNTYTVVLPTSMATGQATITGNAFDSASTQTALISTNTFGVNIILATPTLALSNTLLDSGQWETLTATASGGTTPYTYNFYNTTSGSAIGITGCLSLSITTCSFQTSSPTQSNAFTYNVLVIDSASTTNSANSITQTITINTILGQPSIVSPSPLSQAPTNTLTWTTSFTGGTSSFTYNWVVYNTITGTIFANILESNSFRGNAFTYTLLSGDVGNTLNANVAITDSATTNEIANSIKSSTITIVPAYTALSGLTFTISNSTLAELQPELFTASFSNGASPYSYNYVIINTITNSIFANMLFTGVTTTSNTWIWTPQVWIAGNTLEANVIITDAHPATINSIYKTINTYVTQTTSGGGGGGSPGINTNLTSSTILPTNVSNSISLNLNPILLSSVKIANFNIYLWVILILAFIIVFWYTEYDYIWLITVGIIILIVAYSVVILHVPMAFY